MKISVIIPHRNRNANLAHCVWSLNRAAMYWKDVPFEIIVVDSHSAVPPSGIDMEIDMLLRDPAPKGVFNKPRCQNIGIEHANGDVLVFLDADAIVPTRWLKTTWYAMHDNPTLTRLCYRVRYLPENYFAFANEHERIELFSKAFANYDLLDKHRRPVYGRGHEGYGLPERDRPGRLPIFGNSQFAMHRHVLGGLRYNEDYEGRGFEDLWFIRETWKRDPAAYNAILTTDPNGAIFHIKNPIGGPDWRVPALHRRNKLAYNGSWDGMKTLLMPEKKQRSRRTLTA